MVTKLCHFETLKALFAQQQSYILKRTYMYFAKMQFVSNCHTVVLYKAISRLSIYKKSVVYLSECRVMFICKIREMRSAAKTVFSLRYRSTKYFDADHRGV